MRAFVQAAALGADTTRVTEAPSFPRAAGPVETPRAPAVAATLATAALARLSFEIHRIPRPGSRITSDIEGRVLNRCVMAALEVLSAESATVELAGTEVRPVVDATFEGVDPAPRAARAAGLVLAAVRRVQRAAENEFQVVGAMSAGHVGRTSGGVVVTTGSSDAVLHRLRERAAPGQILLSQGAFDACRKIVEAVPLAGTSAGNGHGDGGGQVPDAYVLVGLREPGTLPSGGESAALQGMS